MQAEGFCDSVDPMKSLKRQIITNQTQKSRSYIQLLNAVAAFNPDFSKAG